ncbi:hypothetical protein PHLGIDRAFT_115276 [Phlebiopsis gigantea 11061_1 CR5-6]|uniref:Uncharacterized protein n=1 Tax=Phlebiopsis gigantea (strain 11061_1 CR5-6) TaxID=745531 RepID=A0A0C3PT98_PHLG1|nr:hypothetical protein PHLGIDRAFT_115276 [Phlebiopsis gigantea 11061_1 CR5-6]
MAGKIGSEQTARPGATSGDLIRRSRPDNSRTSLLDGTQFSSPLAHYDRDGTEEGYDAHTAHDRTVSMATRHNITKNAQPKGFVKLRTSKSMHQRSENAGSSVEPPSHGYLHQRATTHHPANYDIASHSAAHSRSASVASSPLDHIQPDDDLSSIMMRGATNLRNVKFEIEELRREITFLQAQVNTSKLEKEELARRLKAVKATAKQGLDSTSRSLESVRASMEGLKTQSETSFAFVAQAKAALPDVVELRGTVAEAVKGLELVTRDDGHLIEVLKAKEIIDELKMECSGSSQVIDMLREKLQSVGSELIDAKIRSSELEGLQSADREALRSSSTNLSNASEQVCRLAEELKIQQTELNKALLLAADFESKLNDANIRVQELDRTIVGKNGALEELPVLQGNLDEARLLLAERDAQISELRGLQARLDSAMVASTEYASQARAFEAGMKMKDEAIVGLEMRISERESQLRAIQDVVLALKEEAAAATSRESSLRDDLKLKQEDITAMKIAQVATQESSNDVRKELEQRSESLYELQAKYQVMEERYETQLVTTRCAQQTQAELQERLMEIQTNHARELEATTGKRDQEIALLAEQKASLLVKIEDLEASARMQREELIAIKADYDERVAKEEDSHRIQLELAEKRVNEVHVALEDARAIVKNHEDQVASAKQEMQTQREELREALRPSPVHKEAVDALTAQITALRLENTELNEEEKMFINTLVQTSQSIHEQELVSKGNELRRRDNLVKELQAKIQSLESTLNKHIKAQSKAVVLHATENRSLIDPDAWAKSSNKGTSHPRVADEDMPSTNVDNTATAKPTPAPVRPSSRVALAPVPQLDPNTTTKARPTRTPARLPRYPPTGAPTAQGTLMAAKKTVSPVQSSSPLVYPQPKTPAVRGPGAQNAKKPGANAHNGPRAMFSRLATDCSDEIVDFEERSHKPSPIGTPPAANANEDAKDRARLGKRSKPASSPEGGQSNAKRPRRLRSHMRSRVAPQQDEPAPKIVEVQSKNKTKGRRV